MMTPSYVTSNEIVLKGVSFEGLRWSFTEVGDTNLWHPVTWLSHMMDVQVFGSESASGHHLVNVLWHLLGVAGFFFVLLQLTDDVRVAFLVALIWAIHPMRVQSVGWISERKDLLSGAFFFWSWWGWQKWVRSQKRSHYLFALGMFLFAGMSKASVVPLPVILWIGSLMKEGWTWRNGVSWFVKVLPFVFVSIAVAVLTIYFQRSGDLWELGEGSMPLERRLMLMPVSLWWYVQGLFWPSDGRLWVYPPVGQWRDLLAPSMGLIGLAIAAIVAWQKCRRALLGLSAFLLLWAPVSGIVPVSYYFVADRYSYLMHAGLLIFFAIGFTSLVRSVREVTPLVRSLGKAAFLGGIIVLSWMTFERTQRWESNEALYSHERDINPQSLLAPVLLGHQRKTEGNYEEALALYLEAQRIHPEAGLASTSAADILVIMGLQEEAIAKYEQACIAKALKSAKPFRELAKIQVSTREFESAVKTLKSALIRFPQDISVMMDLAALLTEQIGDRADALRYYQKVLKIAPGHLDALQGMGVNLIESGREKEGIKVLQELVRRDPKRSKVKKFLERRKALPLE